MFAAGERRGAGKAEQVVREGVEPQGRLKRIRQLLFGDRLDDQREAVLPPQERPAARAEREHAGIRGQGRGVRRDAERRAEQRPPHPGGRKPARLRLFDSI